MSSVKLILHDADMVAPELDTCLVGQTATLSRRCPGNAGANEDSAAVLTSGKDIAVLVVADGCGGMASGHVASKLAVNCIVEAVQVAGPEDESLRGAILDGIEAANRAVRALGTGAATTLAVVALNGNSLRAFHVGDSTALLVGNRGKVKLETRAHSPVGYGVEAGLIGKDEAIHHEDLHLVSNVIGHEDTHIEIGPVRTIAPRDTVLLGTDGLFDNLYTAEIVEFIRKGPLLNAAQQLSTVASERMECQHPEQPGKPDDLTFVLYRPTR